MKDDALRQRWENSSYNGSGYVTLVAAELGYECSGKYAKILLKKEKFKNECFINRK